MPLRLCLLTGLTLLLSACDLFPRRDAARTDSLVEQLETRLAELEQVGLLNPNTVSLVYIHRYGTSYGGSVPLSGRSPDGRPLDAEQMVEACLQTTRRASIGAIKGCLRQRYANGQRLRYSHAGIAYKFPGRGWRVRQSLRASNTGQHFEWFGTLEQFVDIGLVEPRIEVAIPTLDLQNRLATELLVNRAGAALIDPDYNLAAGAFQTREQMSNQFVLEITAAALQGEGVPNTRANAQAFLAENGFRPTVILLGGLRSLGKFDALIPTVDLSEQPYARRFEIGEIITVAAVRDFLIRLGHIVTTVEVTAR